MAWNSSRVLFTASLAWFRTRLQPAVLAADLYSRPLWIFVSNYVSLLAVVLTVAILVADAKALGAVPDEFLPWSQSRSLAGV
jgi:hypothetical protein